MSRFVNDKTILGDFMGVAFNTTFEIPATEDPKFVVSMRRDGSLRLLDSNDKYALGLAEEYLKEREDFYGFTYFPTLVAANAFVKQLQDIGQEEIGKHLVLVPPTTDYSPAEGDAMAVKVADMMASEEKNTSSFPQVAEKKSPQRNIMESALKAASASMPGNSGSAGAGSNGAASGPVVFDMGKCKLDFGKKGTATGSPSGCDFDVSAVFPHVSKEFGVAVVVIKAWKTTNLWHFDSKYMNLFNEHFITNELVKKGRDVPLFLQTLIDMPIVSSSNANDYKRQRNSTWTINKQKFLIMVPQNGFGLEKYVESAFKTMGTNFRSTNENCGMQYANWLAENKRQAYERSRGISGSRTKNQTHEQFAEEMQRKLVGVFSKMTPNYNVPLDTWMTHGHIKQFLTDNCGYSSWDEVPKLPNNDLRNKVLKKFPRETFPHWDNVEIPDF